jgi:DNA-binding response OmpR family regulator
MSQKFVLIGDDDEDLADALAHHCRRLGVRTRVAYNARDVLRAAELDSPDAICLDVHMPGGDGLTVCEAMSAWERPARTPVIVLTGDTDRETVRRCHQLCAYYVPKCPNVWARIEPLLVELLGLAPMGAAASADGGGATAAAADRSRPFVHAGDSDAPRPGQTLLDALRDFLPAAGAKAAGSRRERGATECPWVLSIDDDREFSYALKLRLEAHGVAVVRAFDGADGCAAALAYPADVVLLDVEMPHGRGDEVLRRLKGHALTKDIPVVVVTGRRDKALERKLIGLGAAAYLQKPVDMAALLAALGRHVDVLPWRKQRFQASVV